MGKEQLPAFISHTVLVHGGSYSLFIQKLHGTFPLLQIKFAKRVKVHYYILQLEDHSEIPITKKQLYDLPILAMREEFSKYIFFKNIKSYNNVLKRMCDADKNPNAPYLLTQHMMTPFEKGKLVNLQEAPSLSLSGINENNEEYSIYYDKKILQNSMNVLSELFKVDKCKIGDKEESFIALAKKQKWTVGIH